MCVTKNLQRSQHILGVSNTLGGGSNTLGCVSVSGDTIPCNVTPAILHGVVSGDTAPCRMARVALHGVVSPEKERISVGLLTLDRKLKASREGSE